MQITGSKNFGGPPFSGALVVPPQLTAKFSRLDSLPVGLGDYAAQAEWPKAWKITTSILSAHCNVGLLLRWTAAVREMRSFYSVPNHLRLEILRDLVDVVRRSIDSTPGIVPLPTNVLDRGEISPADCWDQIATIFSFRVAHQNECSGEAYLTHENIQTMHRWLNTDLSSIPQLRSSDSQQSLAALLCHVGQPVELCRTLDSHTSVLRFCIGANVVSRVVFDDTLGKTIQERLEFEQQSIRQVFEKIGLILANWTMIDQYEEAVQKSSKQIRQCSEHPSLEIEYSEAQTPIC